MKSTKTILVTASVMLSGMPLLAVPTVKQDSVVMTQSGGDVTISYVLEGEPGIVTVDIQTNGVSIGAQHLTCFDGDVNKVVPTGNRTITWKPYKAWPDQQTMEARAVVSAWTTSAPPDYMVASLTVPGCVYYYADAASVPGGVTDDRYKTEYLVLRKIPAANVRWRMGSPTNELGRATTEKAHEVSLAKDFYMGLYEVTQRQYELIMGQKPSYFNQASEYAMRPVETVSWHTIRGAGGSGEAAEWPKTTAVTATSFMGRLRQHTGLDDFDLPVEAQWEFACRATQGSALNNGTELSSRYAAIDNLTAIARYKYDGGYVKNAAGSYEEPVQGCSTKNGTNKVGSQQPNMWGLYDMSGNVVEWCLDWWQDDNTTCDANQGPTSAKTYRVKRGGGWNDMNDAVRSASRSYGSGWNNYNNTGFRVCRTLAQ